MIADARARRRVARLVSPPHWPVRLLAHAWRDGLDEAMMHPTPRRRAAALAVLRDAIATALDGRPGTVGDLNTAGRLLARHRSWRDALTTAATARTDAAARPYLQGLLDELRDALAAPVTTRKTTNR